MYGEEKQPVTLRCKDCPGTLVVTVDPEDLIESLRDGGRLFWSRSGGCYLNDEERALLSEPRCGDCTQKYNEWALLKLKNILAVQLEDTVTPVPTEVEKVYRLQFHGTSFEDVYRLSVKDELGKMHEVEMRCSDLLCPDTTAPGPSRDEIVWLAEQRSGVDPTFFEDDEEIPDTNIRQGSDVTRTGIRSVILSIPKGVIRLTKQKVLWPLRTLWRLHVRRPVCSVHGRWLDGDVLNGFCGECLGSHLGLRTYEEIDEENAEMI